MNINVSFRLLPALCCFLLFSTLAWAQGAEIYVAETTADNGENFTVDIRATDLDSAVGISFSIEWDTLALRYAGVENVILGGNEGSNFNITKVDTGFLGFAIIDESLESIEIPSPDGLLFSVRFVAEDNVDAVTTIGFGSDPVDIVVSDSLTNPIRVTFNAGNVVVGTPTAAREVVADDPRFTAAPNPFGESVLINATFGYTSPALLELFDANGRNIAQRKLPVAGQHKLILTAADFPAAGTYLLKITTDREILHRRVVHGPR